MISEFVELILKIYKALNERYTPEKAAELISWDSNYNRKVVSAAYGWIYDKIIRDVLNRKALKEDSRGQRFPSEYELHLIGEENFSYLQHFYNIGIMTNGDVESVIDKLLIIPANNINRSTIDALIISLFLDIDNYVLPGSRLLLFSSDKIN